VEQVSDMSSSSDRTFCLLALAIVHAGSGGHNRDWSTAEGSGGHKKIGSEMVLFRLGAFLHNSSRGFHDLSSHGLNINILAL
jgi:hypothetical protein